MQKVMDLLEKHVQWLALGLGVVWLLLMTWTYVINPPAQVEIGTETLTAGEVDEYTVANAVRPLEEAMKPKEAPPMHVDNFAARWLKRMDWQEAEPIQTEGLIASARLIPDRLFHAPRGPLPPGGTEIALDPTKPAVQGGVATIPVLPAAVVSDWRFGRSTIIEPPPIVPIGQPQPPAPLVPPEIDKDWITQSFKVNLPSIAAAFQKAQVPPPPPGTGNTAFLRVEMARQELMPNGNWGNDTVLKPLPPLQPNMVRQEFPKPKAGIHQETAYLNWAVQNTGDIVQPAFYQTVPNKGDIWQRPGEPAQAINAGAFNPQQYLTGPIPPELTPEQRKMVLDARREQVRLREQQRRQNPRTPRGRPGDQPPEMEEGMMNFAPLDAERPKFLQVRPPYRPPYNPNLPPDMQGMEEEMMMEDPAMMEQAMAPQILGVGTPDLDYPAGQFDPATWAAPVPGAPVPPPGAPVRPQDVSIWAHDDTVQPGKTYRYRVRYTLLNPLFNKPGAAKNPADARVFAIESPFSDWGPAIEVPSLTNFFIANALMNQGKVRFDVYHWEKGQQHHTVVTAGPGDMIASNQNGVKFDTGHTIVELRPAVRGGDPVVYLANGKGQAVVRTQRGDLNHPIYKKLKEIVAAAQAQAQAAAGGAIPAR